MTATKKPPRQGLSEVANLYYYVRAEVTYGIILPYAFCVKHRRLSMNAPTGPVFPYTAKRNPVSDHFDGRWIKRVSMGVMRMDTGLQPKLRSIIQILRLSNKP